jgi:hypothetical protein
LQDNTKDRGREQKLAAILLDVRVHGKILPIRDGRDRAVAVRPQQPYAGMFVTLDHVFRRMTERIRFANLYDCDARRNSREEGLRRRRLASVVRHFQEIGRERRILRDEIFFGAPLDVTCQQEVHLTV